MEESLLKAAATNDLRLLRFCLENNISVNSTNMNGLAALHIACKEGNDQIVQELISSGANLNAKTNMGNTALHISALAGRLGIARLLIESGANINVQTNRGFTPLYMAAQQNHIEVARALLSAGADPYLLADEKYAPLAVASQQGHTELMEMLLTHEQVLEGCERMPKLHVAVKKEEIEIVESLLRGGAEVDELGPEGTSALCTAINYGCYKAAICLLNHGAGVDMPMRNENRPLHFAAKSGRLRFVELLLARGAGVNVTNRSGISPLHCAASGGHQQILEILLESGADPCVATVSGLCPLHYACQKNQDGCARLLIAAGAQLEATTKNGLTALHTAAHYGNSVIITQLINRNADFAARTSNGFTPLHVACSRPAPNAVMELVPYGMLDEPDLEGWTPLQTACYAGNLEIVRLLCESGADLSRVNKQGMGPIHFAAANGSLSLLEYLIKQKADVNLRANNGETPLLLAVYSVNVGATRLLINHGGDCLMSSVKCYNVHHMACKHDEVELMALLHNTLLRQRGCDDNLPKNTFKGFAPIHVAAKYGNHQVVQYLLSIGDLVERLAKRNLTPLLVATHYGSLEVVKVLLSYNANVGQTAKNGFTALHIAVLYDHIDIAQLLLSRGASPDCLAKGGFAPLHISASRSSLEGVSLLLKYNAHHSIISNEGITPMHYCAKEDCVDCAVLLYNSGASLNDQNRGGYTPLLIACYYGSLNMILFLLKNEAQVNLQTKIGYTALHQAAQEGSVQVVRLLLEYGANPDILCYGDQTALDIATLFENAEIVAILEEHTSVTTGGPIHRDKRLLGEPLGVENLFVESEDETSDGHTLGRLRPKHDLSIRPILNSFDGVSTTILRDHEEPKLETPTNAPLVSTFSIFEMSRHSPYMNSYSAIVNRNSHFQIAAFDCYGNPHFQPDFCASLSPLMQLVPPHNCNLFYHSNGIPVVGDCLYVLQYDHEGFLVAKDRDHWHYIRDEDDKQISKPTLGVKLRGDGCYATEDGRLQYDTNGTPLVEGKGTLYADSHRNLFYVGGHVLPLYSGKGRLKREPKEVMTTFDHNGVPLLGFVPSFPQHCFFMLNKNGIPLVDDGHQFYFDEEDRLVTVDESLVVGQDDSLFMNTTAVISAVTETAVLVDSPHYDSLQFNYYGFPILYGDQRQDDVDFYPNGLLHLNSRVLCHSQTRKPVLWPLAYSDWIFDCCGTALPSSNLSSYRKTRAGSDCVVLSCDSLTGNLIFLPDGFPYSDCVGLHYGNDGLLYCEGGLPVMDSNLNHVRNLAVHVVSNGANFAILSDTCHFDCFGMPLVTFDIPSLCLTACEDGRVCVVDGEDLGGKHFLCNPQGMFVFRRRGVGSVVANSQGKVLNLCNYDASITSGTHDCYVIKYSAESGLVFTDESIPLLKNANLALLHYSEGNLVYDNLPVLNDDSTPFEHPGAKVLYNEGVPYLLKPSFNWRGLPMIFADSPGYHLLRNEDYTLHFTDGIASTPLYCDRDCTIRMTAVIPPESADHCYSSLGEPTTFNLSDLSRQKGVFHLSEDCLYMPSGIPYVETPAENVLFYQHDKLFCHCEGTTEPVLSEESLPFVDPRGLLMNESLVKAGPRGKVVFDVNGLPLLKGTSEKIEALPSGIFVTLSATPRVLLSWDTGRPLIRGTQTQGPQTILTQGPQTILTQGPQTILTQGPQNILTQVPPSPQTSLPPTEHSFPVTLLSAPGPVTPSPDFSHDIPDYQIAKFRVSLLLDARPKVMESVRLPHLRITALQDTVMRPTLLDMNFCQPSTSNAPDLIDGDYLANKIITITANSDSFVRPLFLDLPYITSPDPSREFIVMGHTKGQWAILPSESLRVSLDTFPVILALISRPKLFSLCLEPSGGSFSPGNNCHLQIPPGAVVNSKDISLQVILMGKRHIEDILGADSFVSPVLAMRPLNMNFCQNIKIKLPLLGPSNKDVLFKYGHNIRILKSSTYVSTLWEDVTYSTDVVLQPGGDVTFTTCTTGKYCVVASMDPVKLSQIYKRSLVAHYRARFVVFGMKGPKLICCCVTDSVDISYLNHHECLLMTNHLNLPANQTFYVSISGGGCYSLRPPEYCTIQFDPFSCNLLEMKVGNSGMTTVTFFTNRMTYVKEPLLIPSWEETDSGNGVVADSKESREELAVVRALGSKCSGVVTTDELIMETELTIED